MNLRKGKKEPRNEGPLNVKSLDRTLASFHVCCMNVGNHIHTALKVEYYLILLLYRI